MSATAESEKFAKYFSIPIRGRLQEAPIIPIEGRTYKISEYYLEDLRSLGDLPFVEEDRPGISYELMDLVVKLIVKFDNIEADERQFKDSVNRGAVLIFLPGLSDINDLESK